MLREKQIKNYSVEMKNNLIGSTKNQMKYYVPLKHVILKRQDGNGEVLEAII